MLTQDLSREATSRQGFIEFEDFSISESPLIYQSRFISGPLKGREIPSGEKINLFALPFNSQVALVTDSKNRFLGEIPLFKKCTPINPGAFAASALIPFDSRPEIKSPTLIEASIHKHQRIADILTPSRHLHTDQIQHAQHLRHHNQRVIKGDPITDTEIKLAASARHLTKKTLKATANLSEQTLNAINQFAHITFDD